MAERKGTAPCNRQTFGPGGPLDGPVTVCIECGVLENGPCRYSLDETLKEHHSECNLRRADNERDGIQTCNCVPAVLYTGPTSLELQVEAVRRAIIKAFNRDFPEQTEHEEDCDELEGQCRCDKDIQGIVKIHNASRRNFLNLLEGTIESALVNGPPRL